jgi:tRNA(fMet)-specific endonuclease VapC
MKELEKMRWRSVEILTIGSKDLQIAAITLAHNLILVTHNTGEFKRVVGLTIEDWETEA